MPPEQDNVSVDFVDKWKRKRTNQDGHIGLTLLIDRLWMRISFISLSHQCVPLWLRVWMSVNLFSTSLMTATIAQLHDKCVCIIMLDTDILLSEREVSD